MMAQTLRNQKPLSAFVAVCTFYVTYLIVSTTNYSPDLLSRNSDVKILPKMKTVDKIKHIAFLRVPKTGSSTLACIFLRFGIRNKLDIYLPKIIYVSRKKQKLLLEEKKCYDIFVIHTYYDSTFFTNIVPRDSPIIGLVREPIQRIISHAFYFKHLRKRKEMKSLSEQEFIHKVLRNTANYGAENVMATYFGMERNGMERNQTKKDYIHQYLESLNTSFSLVLVLEKFNESLVLLKRILNWSFADILYGAKKVNTYGQVPLGEEEKNKLISNNMLDFEIYNYFMKELESKVKRERNDFQLEVLHFENILHRVKTFCDNAVNGSKIEFPSSKWDRSFEVLSSECELIFRMDIADIKKRSIINLV
ncbi:galactose-3-O-sulfotransferase 2-like [Mercenaria mercenaria]|uniref:galactose-3-O-sulfotransferase 2-like n=1 Tax=Mercenaria mercenaria TaxID=6596 RepID=UPI00234E3BCA|nr:galactose-3-O-sulfotransferase 2-like [Mercenaria mercenaria]